MTEAEREPRIALWPIFDANGNRTGTIMAPAMEVLSAARVLNRWLSNHPPGTVLYNLKLAQHPNEIKKENT